MATFVDPLSMKPRREETAVKMLHHVTRVGKLGITMRELTQLLRCTASHADKAGQLLRERGQAVLFGAAGSTPGTMYLPEFVPQPKPKPEKKPKPQPKRKPVPGWSEEVNARRAGGAACFESDEAIVPKRVRVVRGPSNYDMRHTVRELPAGHKSVLDPRECRAWVAAVTGGA
jgi:hypothetical protein